MLHGAWLSGSGLAATERRLVLDTGVALRPRAQGLYQLYFTTLIGDDVGYYRAKRNDVQAGFGVRWGS